MLYNPSDGNGDAAKKYQTLLNYIKQLGSAVVSYSGGTDSSLLLKAATDALHENAVAVMVVSEVTIKRELRRAEEFCAIMGADLYIINMSLLSNPLFAKNPRNRCYICKKAMFAAIKDFAIEHGIPCIIEGTNKSDRIEDRPGFAAVTEEGVISPLRECGLTKAEVREVSRQLELVTWDTPSNSCLATRFSYGEALTKERLDLVEKAEDFLVSNGIKEVRVKVGGRNE